MAYFPYSFWTTTLKRGLLAFWSFNDAGNVGKDNYNGFNLTISGSTSSVTGLIGKALQNNDDSNAFAEVADPNKKFNLTADKTFVCWFKTDNALGAGSYIFGKFFSSPGTSYAIRYGSAGYVVFTFENGTTFETAGTGQILSSDVWFFCVAKHTLSSKKISIQINNGTIIEETYTGVADDDNQNFRALEKGSNDVTIDSLGVWDRLLTSEEITYLYNNGAGREYPF